MASHVLIFDIGKTNKKVLVLNEEYQLVYELSEELPQTTDEDGFPCEDIIRLKVWVLGKFSELTKKKDLNIRAINFSGYGASFVLLNNGGKTLAPVYNYLKPFSNSTRDRFMEKYDDTLSISLETHSPWLGNLNSGLQLFALQYERPEFYKNIKRALHLPQYLSFILSNEYHSELTSLGCHTLLWDFKNNNYHPWVLKEKIDLLFPANTSTHHTIRKKIDHKMYSLGIGIHDSSAALVPYFMLRKNPFILLSTGTWSIALNPFEHTDLSEYELHQDCLSYMSFKGSPVKASRLFLGHEHQEETARIANQFQINSNFYEGIRYIPDINLMNENIYFIGENGLVKSGFEKRDLSTFENEVVAYHQLIHDFVTTQLHSIALINSLNTEMDLLVDGGFAKNEIFMSLLSKYLPRWHVYSAEVPQASAIGAAMVIHQAWNSNEINQNLLQVHKY